MEVDLEDRFQMYTEAMKEVEDAKVKTKHEGDKILEKYEKASNLSNDR